MVIPLLTERGKVSPFYSGPGRFVIHRLLKGTLKDIFTDIGNVVGDRNGIKACALLERAAIYLFYALAPINRPKPGAFHKSAGTDGFNIIGNSNTPKGSTALEHTVIDQSNALADSNAIKPGTIHKDTVVDFGYGIGDNDII